MNNTKVYESNHDNMGKYTCIHTKNQETEKNKNKPITFCFWTICGPVLKLASELHDIILVGIELQRDVVENGKVIFLKIKKIWVWAELWIEMWRASVGTNKNTFKIRKRKISACFEY